MASLEELRATRLQKLELLKKDFPTVFVFMARATEKKFRKVGEIIKIIKISSYLMSRSEIGG
jgi:hypothetical protein